MNTLKDEDEAEQLEEEVEIDENDLKEGIFELGFMKRAAEKREQTHLRLLEDAFLDVTISGYFRIKSLNLTAHRISQVKLQT